MSSSPSDPPPPAQAPLSAGPVPAAGDAAPMPGGPPGPHPEVPSGAPAPVDPAEHAELQRQGAKAAVRGEGRAANPMLEAVNQPLATGEDPPVWALRRDAWDSGHDAQQRLPEPPAGDAGPGAAPAAAVPDEAIFGMTRILTFSGAQGLTSASGFFFERDGRLFVVTSRHVLFDGPSRHAPDRIEIDVRTDVVDLTRWASLSLLLYRGGKANWRQARDSGGEVDVAALELDRDRMPDGCALRAFGLQHLAGGADRFDVGAPLAIPGFPLGFFDTRHHLPVVRQASIASSYGVRFQGLGFFLTDARMHRGSSGSPVLSRRDGAALGAPRWHLLGVHSSRMDMATRDVAQDESLGLNCAWYADVLLALTAP